MMLEARNITRTYREGILPVEVLKGISLRVENGEILAVMGASGSGKSTLLYHLGLLDAPDSGDILLDGQVVSGLPEDEKSQIRLKKIGYIFQDYALLPELTALENVYLPSMVLGSDRKFAEELLRLVGLEKRMDFLPHQLSGGEQQRVSIARSMVNRPSILLADEPCANLDSENSKKVLSIFSMLNASYKITVVMVTHESWHAKYAGRIVTLKDGQLAESAAEPHFSPQDSEIENILRFALKDLDDLKIKEAAEEYAKIQKYLGNTTRNVTGTEEILRARLGLYSVLVHSLRNLEAFRAEKEKRISDLSSLRNRSHLSANTRLGKFVDSYIEYLKKY